MSFKRLTKQLRKTGFCYNITHYELAICYVCLSSKLLLLANVIIPESEITEYILGSKKKVCTSFSAIFHCPLCLMSTYLVPKSRSKHVHYNRDFNL